LASTLINWDNFWLWFGIISPTFLRLELIPDPCEYRHNSKLKLYLRMLCCATGIWDQMLGL